MSDLIAYYPADVLRCIVASLFSHFQKAVSTAADTVRNYRTYLTPFVKWLEDRAKFGTILISTQSVRQFMDREYRLKQRASYKRIYSQIVDFVNQYLDKRIMIVKAIGFRKSKSKLQFPNESVGPVHEYLKAEYEMLKLRPPT